MAKEEKSKERQYLLKPGAHQFAPGSHAAHTNENTTDVECAWYIKKYPHITGMFLRTPKSPSQTDTE
ncbi:MAG: hypothetical protein JWR50_3183 [Mucilaginibacter sp.]|nr:hypothetical protein [Mucilaginibacter sp.]